ncbi:MAG: hypothetical protein QOJ39_3688 [Candidatus Eremiobacteraeota bacterium]|jgi:hypothetical protein|nr:hypothetical protein [Candidatus Eremiobacteraeota bacterium]MEA2721824.1 hypothetical protein [Candidatus Eremiobacteraeota bacterium]
MAHVELIAAFTAFTGLVVVWLAVPSGVRTAQRASEPAPAPLQQIAA